MPPIPKQAVASTDSDRLRPYAHHGVHLVEHGAHAVGDCPFCRRSGKFSVSVETGLWRCFVCGTGTEAGGGNAHVFLRLLWERSVAATPSCQVLSEGRGYLDEASLRAWGVCKSITDGSWLVPGYDVTGKLAQVYKRVRVLVDGKWTHRLLPTPGVWPEGRAHALHMAAGSFDPEKPQVHVCEGPWDGVAFWEVARQTRFDGEGLVATGGESTSLIADSNVVAVPGCWGLQDQWLPLFRGKDVTLWYDSDHPRVVDGKTLRAGLDGMCRVAKKLSGIARSVSYVRWGPEGYDPEKPAGWDVRDHLHSGGPTIIGRRERLADLILKKEPAPADWFGTTPMLNGKHKRGVDSKRCKTWADLEPTWADALEWRQCIGDILAVLLAVSSSTLQSGNQLFLQVIGPPGSAKTTLCEGLLVSDHCHHLEHLTSFYSGWKKPGDDDADCSLLARINGKTLVTPEADVLMSSPKFVELMGQQRRIFDGKGGKTYANTDEDRIYEGLRTPWIMAGTQKLMSVDQSGLGDRFLRIMMDDPTSDIKRAILRRALRTERTAILESSNGTAESITDPKLRLAYAMTGGYVDHLRASIEDMLSRVDMDAAAEDRCIDLAELTADLRARPEFDLRKPEVVDTKELPTRLARQFGRMALCLAAVFNKRAVDADVLRIVRKAALDTSYTHSVNLVRWMCAPNRITGRPNQDTGLMLETLRSWAGVTEERMVAYLSFLRKIDVVQHVGTSHSRGYWRLTERVYELYHKISE